MDAQSHSFADVSDLGLNLRAFPSKAVPTIRGASMIPPCFRRARDQLHEDAQSLCTQGGVKGTSP